MKNTVIEFFQNLPDEKHEQFNKAYELYRQSPTKNLAVERSFNVMGYSERTLDNLLYDLQKMHGITDLEKMVIVRSEKGKVKSEKLEVSGEELEVKSQKLEVSGEEELKALVLENENLQDKKAELEEELEAVNEENENIKDELDKLKSLPKIDAKSIRQEFPFLNDKECPDELKILMADKITAWNRYLETHAYLQKIETGEVNESEEHQAELAKEAIFYFDENQKIYDELNAYQTTGKVLGKHSIFKRLQLTREVEAMSAEELVKYKGSSAKYFSINKSDLAKAEKAKDTEKIELITARVAEREQKLALVNKKLGINPK